MGIHRSVIEEARKHGGFITRTQVEALGIAPSAVDRRIRSGDFKVVALGVYQVIRSEAHLDLIRGAILTLPGAVASHHSAAHLLAFPDPPAVHPTVTVHSRTTHKFPGVTVRRTSDLAKAHLTKVAGIPVTNVARTVFDLSGVITFQELDRVVESLIIANRLTMRQLAKVTVEIARRGKRGASNIREVISNRGESGVVDETILERRGRSALASGGLQPAVSQFHIPWDPNRRFDDAYPECRIAIEWDSRSWHSQREAMAADRRRDRDAAAHGWVLLRFTWDDVVDTPADVAASVRALIEARSAGDHS